MQYAIIKDGQVKTINSIKTETQLRNTFPGSEVVAVKDDFSFTGDPRAIDWTTQTVKPLSQQVDEGVVAVPEGSILEGETIRVMSHVERITAGLDKLADGCTIVGDRLEPMTLAERYDAGQVTGAQYNTSIRTERRVKYAMDADPLYMEYLYDSESKRDTAPAKKQAWIAKVDEIKAALPLKGE